MATNPLSGKGLNTAPRVVPTLVELSNKAALENIRGIQDFTLIPEHLVIDLFMVCTSHGNV
jgi:hypothetical protein